ncbi:MAG: RNA polymerase sigma factor [Fimbriimonadaceae bacterium]
MADAIDVEREQPLGEVSRLAEHFFRHESGSVIAALTRSFGIDRLQLAEDAVQEALVRALHNWPYYGIPDNPAAWLTQTAKNVALDHLRRENLSRNKQTDISEFTNRWSAHFAFDDAADLAPEIDDARLRLIFLCCHPVIPEDSQAALALRVLCGFSVAEIAQGFLTTDAAVAKRLTRAKQRLSESEVQFELPVGEDLTVRLDGVLKTLYLLFNEGYKASTGESLVREDLCAEAIRLATLVSAHKTGNCPRTHALLALMLFNAARFTTRVDSGGQIVRLEDQVRAKWDRALIARGLFHLGRSAEGGELNWFHLQGAIAALHCTASEYVSTDWNRIAELYDDLVRIDDSPVVALNRAVAIAHVRGPRAGIEAVEAIQNRDALESYHLLYAVLAEFELQVNDFASAAGHLRKALKLSTLKPEQSLLTTRLRECEAKILRIGTHLN